MAKYVDGYAIAIPKKSLAQYKKMASLGCKVWMKYGALDYKECVGDDLAPKGCVFNFKKALSVKPTETVIFAYIVYRSKKHRDAVNAKVMADPSMNQFEGQPMPFDMKRMAFGGFDVLVSSD